VIARILSTLCLLAPGEGAPSPPDLVLVLVDDVGWPDLERAATPNLDRLAAEGLTFERYYSQPSSSPTRYGLVYGQYGFRDGVGSYVGAFNENLPGVPHARLSIAELLKGRGYATAAFGTWQLSSERDGYPREAARVAGFDAWRAGVAGVLAPGDYDHWRRIDDGLDEWSGDYQTTAVADAFLEWWDERADDPRFAYVAFYAAQPPFHTPPPGLLPVGAPRPANDRERYEAMITALDHELGRMLAAPGADEALVFVVSDNGTPSRVPPPDHRSPGYRSTVFEGGIHVPLLVRGPGVATGRSDALTHCVDLPATLAELAGAPVPEGAFLDSRSFADVLVDPSRRARSFAFSHTFEPNGVETNGGEEPRKESWALLTDAPPWKLVLQEGHEALYRLDRDPGESTPLDLDLAENAAARERLLALKNELLGP